ncbi:MAG: hypothetical protein V3U72_03445 [Candidatus Aenigmarchaeota archaeon]
MNRKGLFPLWFTAILGVLFLAVGAYLAIVLFTNPVALLVGIVLLIIGILMIIIAAILG